MAGSDITFGEGIVDRAELNRQGILDPIQVSRPGESSGTRPAGRPRPQSQAPLAKFLRGVLGGVAQPLEQASTGQTAAEAEAVAPTGPIAQARSQAAQGAKGSEPQPIEEVQGWLDAQKNFLNQIQEQSQQLATSSKFFTLNELLDRENLSPEARLQLDQLTQDHMVQVARASEIIRNTQDNIAMFDRVFQQDQGRNPNVVDQAKGLLASSNQPGTTGGRGVNPVVSDTGANVQRRADDRMAEAVAGIQGDVEGRSPEVWNLVDGGAETDAQRAKNAQNMEQAMITLGNAANDTSGLASGNGGDSLTSKQESAIDQAAKAQLDYLGIANETERMKAEAAFKFAMSAEVTNMVREKEDITREYENAVAAIQLDSQQSQDEAGLGLSFDPGEAMWETAVNTALDGIENLGYTIPGTEEDRFADIATAWTQAVSDQEKQQLMNDPLVQKVIASGVDPEQLFNEMNKAVTMANRKYDSMTNFDLRTYTPGSNELGALVNQATLNLTNDPAMASQIANSHSIHQLIKVRSGGNPQLENKGGNLKGLLGLPEDVYDAVGGWESVKNDPVAQMEIGMAYIISQFGDPASALQDLLDNGSWDFSAFRKLPEFAEMQQQNPAAVGAPTGATGGMFTTDEQLFGTTPTPEEQAQASGMPFPIQSNIVMDENQGATGGLFEQGGMFGGG